MKLFENAYKAASIVLELDGINDRGVAANIAHDALQLIRNDIDSLSRGDLSDLYQVSPAMIQFVIDESYKLSSAFRAAASDGDDHEDRPDFFQLSHAFRRISDLKNIANDRDFGEWGNWNHWNNGDRILFEGV